MVCEESVGEEVELAPKSSLEKTQYGISGKEVESRSRVAQIRISESQAELGNKERSELSSSLSASSSSQITVICAATKGIYEIVPKEPM